MAGHGMEWWNQQVACKPGHRSATINALGSPSDTSTISNWTQADAGAPRKGRKVGNAVFIVNSNSQNRSEKRQQVTKKWGKEGEPRMGGEWACPYEGTALAGAGRGREEDARRRRGSVGLVVGK